jgi:hypothetical protein
VSAHSRERQRSADGRARPFAFRVALPSQGAVSGWVSGGAGVWTRAQPGTPTRGALAFYPSDERLIGEVQSRVAFDAFALGRVWGGESRARGGCPQRHL